jgi:hypothetical protein
VETLTLTRCRVAVTSGRRLPGFSAGGDFRRAWSSSCCTCLDDGQAEVERIAERVEARALRGAHGGAVERRTDGLLGDEDGDVVHDVDRLQRDRHHRPVAPHGFAAVAVRVIHQLRNDVVVGDDVLRITGGEARADDRLGSGAGFDDANLGDGIREAIEHGLRVGQGAGRRRGEHGGQRAESRAGRRRRESHARTLPATGDPVERVARLV